MAFLPFVRVAALLLPACTTPNDAARADSRAAEPAGTKPSADRVLARLPSFPAVPGGPVEVGLEANQLVEAACQVISPEKPEIAAKVAAESLKKAMGRSASVLGHRRIEVPTFLLAKLPVTNAQYARFVAARRRAGVAMRAPFLWWKDGCKDDYESKLEDIGKEFPNTPDAALLYWERHGGTLPYRLLDARGNRIDDQPVVYVTWREANEFAVWLGLRLPLEVEWTRAARGDGTQLWPLTNPEQGLRTDRLKTVAGPFGHMSLFGQVWQFVADTGYRPINGPEAFRAEWQALQQDATGRLVQAPPVWKDDKVVAKGGSFLSRNEPIQLLIDARAPVQTIDAFETLGFRLAKSLRPGHDALFSALRGAFGRSAFGPGQDVDLSNQIGAERYELDNTGFPSAFETVTFAPVNWLSRDANAELAQLVDESERVPMLVGVLMTTSNLAEPVAQAGVYSVLWRHAGVPKELGEAVQQGAKELAVARSGDQPQEPNTGGWRDVIGSFGLREKDLESKDAAEGKVTLVRLEGLEVPTADDCFVLLAEDGKPVAYWKARAKPAVGDAAPSAIALGANAAQKMTAKIDVAVPIPQGNPKRTADFQIEVALDREPVMAARPWRLPAATGTRRD